MPAVVSLHHRGTSSTAQSTAAAVKRHGGTAVAIGPDLHIAQPDGIVKVPAGHWVHIADDGTCWHSQQAWAPDA
jgi:hypothetical protein